MNGQKMKLFICITKSDWGGAQKYVYDIAVGAPKDQFDVSVLLGGDGELKKRLEDAGIKTILLKNSQRDIKTEKEFGLFFELRKIFKNDMPDVVHLNSSKMGFVGALAGRVAGVKKIVFTAHGWAFNEDRGFLSKFLFKIIHILTILLSTDTIGVSEITKDQIGWPFKRKIVVIRNGLRNIDFKDKVLSRDSLSIKIVQENHGATSALEKNPLWIGTISELHKNKGLEYAIKAIAKLKDNIIFIIIGEGEERKKLTDLIKKLGASNKIFLVGRIESASSYLKAFDILTLTSITEALPYFLLEAGSASLPTVASDVGGIPEIIENNKTGMLIQSKKPEKIKETLEYLIENPEIAKILGQNLKEKIDTEFTLSHQLLQTLEIYKS